MQIAYITETYPPEVNGVSLTAARAVGHLRDHGHAVQLIRPRQRGEARLIGADEWRTAGAPIPLYSDLRFGWLPARSLRRQWLPARPDLVHVATPGPLAWSALHAARRLGIPTSADFRTNFHAYSRHYGLGWLAPTVLGYLRRLHALADVSFVPTQALQRELASQGFERLKVVGRGVDAVQFDPCRRDASLRRQWGAADDTRVLLYVGRLAAEKNVALALDSFEQLRRYRPSLRMVVVGDGPQRAALQRAHPDVRFAGVQRGDALARHCASADVFLFPSLTDTFGNVVLEAMASGLATVAFDLAAAAVHVTHGRNGWLAVPGDDQAFIRSASLALINGAPGGAVRREARDSALRADWPRQLDLFEQGLRLAVAQHPPHQVPHAALA